MLQQSKHSNGLAHTLIPATVQHNSGNEETADDDEIIRDDEDGLGPGSHGGELDICLTANA